MAAFPPTPSPTSDPPGEMFLAATWGHPRRAQPGEVWLLPAAGGDGTFSPSPTGEEITVGGRTLHVYDYRVERDGTHHPVGPHELEGLGLRLAIPPPDEDGDWPEDAPLPPQPKRPRGAYVGSHMANLLPGYTPIYNPNIGGGYATEGPSTIVLHMTVSRGLSAGYVAVHPYPPQFWANPYTGDLWQTGDPAQPGRALYQGWGPWTNREGYTLQTELVGVPEVNVETYTDGQLRWIAQYVVVPQARWLASVGRPVNLNQVKYHTDSSGSASEHWWGRMSDAEWDAYNGLCAHIDIPSGNDHWDCSVERLDLIAAYAREILGGGGGGLPTPTDDDMDDDMMRIVQQVGGGGAHGQGTIWAINPNDAKAYPISNPYTVTVLQAHGVLMNFDQMKAKGWTYQTDGGSITTAYQVMPVLEAVPDSKGSPGPASQH